jgi:hypothetical protein
VLLGIVCFWLWGWSGLLLVAVTAPVLSVGGRPIDRGVSGLVLALYTVAGVALIFAVLTAARLLLPG